MPCPRSLRANAIPLPLFGRSYFEARTLPPLSVHSLAVFVSSKPWPLQLFWALQALSAPAHAPCPLHSLTPAHFTTLLAAFAGFALAIAAEARNIEATAEAIAAFFTFIVFSFKRCCGGSTHCLEIVDVVGFANTEMSMDPS